MSKELYISDGNRRMGYTPENDYDPRYYDLCWFDIDGNCIDSEPHPDVIDYLDIMFGGDSYDIVCGSVIYTDNVNIMKFLQEGCMYDPVWFDIAGDDVSTVDELRAFGWTW